MKINFEVPQVLLKAALICASKNDVRFYLNGVAIDNKNVVSTDGHRLFFAEIPDFAEDIPQIIIPRESIEFLIKKTIGIGKKDPEKVMVKVCIDGFEGTLSVLEHKETFRRIDAKFPDWKRIIPKYDLTEYQGEYPTFNWQYMADFQKIAKILLVPKNIVTLIPRIGPSSAASIDFPNACYNAQGVLMPLRA